MRKVSTVVFGDLDKSLIRGAMAKDSRSWWAEQRKKLGSRNNAVLCRQLLTNRSYERRGMWNKVKHLLRQVREPSCVFTGINQTRVA